MKDRLVLRTIARRASSLAKASQVACIVQAPLFEDEDFRSEGTGVTARAHEFHSQPIGIVAVVAKQCIVAALAREHDIHITVTICVRYSKLAHFSH